MTTSPEITNNKLKSSSEAEEEEEEEKEEKEEELIQTPTCPQLALISSKPPLLAFSTGSKQLNIIKTPQGDRHHAMDQEISNSKFALDLNLTASGSTSPSHHQPSQQQQQHQPQPQHQHQHQQQQQQQQQDQVEQLRPESSSAAVCTMEMVQRALNRAEKAMGKREMQAPRNSHHHHRHHHHHSAAAGSSSSSSAHVGGAMSEATSSRSPNSTTSSSNSSSTSSRSSAGLFGGSGVAAATTKGGILEVLKEEQTVDDPLVVTSELGVRGGEESKEDSWEKVVEDGNDESETMVSGQSMLVMGACTRCLMYVMLNKCDPKCPRCESQVPLDFTNATHPPTSKRQRVELPESASEHTQV